MATNYLILTSICSILVSMIRPTIAQDWQSPCPRLFVYEPPGKEPDRWYGIITLLSETELSGVWLRLIFDQPSLQLGNWFGEVKSDDNVEYLVKNRNVKLGAHTPKTIRFFLKYDPDKPVPKLVGFRLNARTVCPEDAPQAETTTTEVHLYVSGGEDASSSERPNSKPNWTNQSPSNPNSIRPRREACGKPVTIHAAPLILFGQNSTPGEWPWHAALYKNEFGTSRYICGGTLLSQRWIVSAAHCVTDLSSGETLSPRIFLVYLGTASLAKFSPGTQAVQISKIEAHPDYFIPRHHHDIALMKTSSPVEYSDYVKPVCLWQGDNSLQGVVGTLGTVVGWGLDETNQFSEILKRTQTPIVDTAECVYSRPDFFAKFTSPTAFCAGFRNGSGACNGDSGSGLVIERPDGKGGTSWSIRGLVSLSVPIKGKSVCDPFEYIVYTDVSKYLPWIKKYLEEAT